MSKIEKIKAEIERLKQNNKAFVEFSPYYDGLTDSLDEILSFIDSLEEEPVSNDLEEAADKHLVEKGYLLTTNNGEHLAEVEAKGLFKAGAQWQKKQDQSTIELAEDHAYLAGQEKVIEKACEWLENYFKGVPGGTIYLEDFKKEMEG